MVGTLKSELENEVSGDTKFIKEFKKQGVWDIKDVPGSKEVSLSRTFQKEDIQLIFSTDALEQDFDLEEGEEEQEDESHQIPLQMIVTKPNHDGSLEISCTATDEGVFVDNVAYFPQRLVADETSQGDWERRGLYGGPKFENLDEELIENFQTFVEERGLDSELSEFIQEYLTFKEEEEYKEWLKNVKDFVAK